MVSEKGGHRLPNDGEFVTEDRQDAQRLRLAFLLAAAFAGLLWLIKLSELAFGLDFSGLSVYPGQLETLPGIALAPLLHGSLSHLFANTAPILMLGTLLLYGYPKAALIVLPAVYLGSGLGVWLFARPAWHLGASGLTFGMMFFVFTVGILRWDRRAIALSLVVRLPALRGHDLGHLPHQARHFLRVPPVRCRDRRPARLPAQGARPTATREEIQLGGGRGFGG